MIDCLAIIEHREHSRIRLGKTQKRRRITREQVERTDWVTSIK